MNEQIQIRLRHAAIEKVFIGEELSPMDYERFTDFIANSPINLAQPNQEQAEAQKAKLINIVQQRFLAPPPQQ